MLGTKVIAYTVFAVDLGGEVHAGAEAVVSAVHLLARNVEAVLVLLVVGAHSDVDDEPAPGALSANKMYLTGNSTDGTDHQLSRFFTGR